MTANIRSYFKHVSYNNALLNSRPSSAVSLAISMLWQPSRSSLDNSKRWN